MPTKKRPDLRHVKINSDGIVRLNLKNEATRRAVGEVALSFKNVKTRGDL